MQQTFVLEVTPKLAKPGSKPELHGCGAAGVPGVTAEMIALHLGKHGHFDRTAKKVRVHHRSHLLRMSASSAHLVRKEDLPEIEVDDKAKEQAPERQSEYPQPNLAEGKPAKAEPLTQEQIDALLEQPPRGFVEPDPELSKQIGGAVGGAAKPLTQTTPAERGVKPGEQAS